MKTSLILPLFSLLFVTALSPFATAAAYPGLGLDKIEGSTLHFKVTEGEKPAPLKTGLFDVTFLGILPAAEGTPLPFVLVSGKTCQNCQNDRAIFMVRLDGAKLSQFVHPGKIHDPKTRALLMESRAFFGECLPGARSQYVVFQRERIDRRSSLQPSVFVAEGDKEFIAERLIERRPPRIEPTLRLVKKKSCHEVVGIQRLMMRKKISLTPKRGEKPEDEEDEDEASPKENNTDADINSQGATAVE